jgi:hypothetical protein
VVRKSRRPPEAAVVREPILPGYFFIPTGMIWLSMNCVQT